MDIQEEFAEIDPAGHARFEAAIRPGDMDLISAHIDALGINYYQGDIVAGSDRIEGELAERLQTTRLTPAPTMAPGTTRPTKNPSPASEGIFFPESGLPRSAQDWENDPILLKELLLRVDREYSRPVGTALYVTENGTAVHDTLVEGPDGRAVHDPRREAFIELHLGATLDAKNEGADVRGFFYWSLMDNFEWAWGYDKRFGIVYVDFETGERTVKDSGQKTLVVVGCLPKAAVLPSASCASNMRAIRSAKGDSRPRSSMASCRATNRSGLKALS